MRGYVLNKLLGVDGIEKITDTTYKFVMPAENVQLSAEFVKEVVQDEPTGEPTDESTGEAPADKEPTGELDDTSDTGIETVALNVFIILAIISSITLVVIRKRK